MPTRLALAAALVSVAAVSCDAKQTDRAQAATVIDAGLDAGDPVRAQLIEEYERWRMERDAVYCGDPQLEVVCSFEERPFRFCDFDETVAEQCGFRDEYVARKNKCGGLTLGQTGPFGGNLWHYNEKFELIGARLSADTTSFCGKLGVRVGQDCELTDENVSLCTQHDE